MFAGKSFDSIIVPLALGYISFNVFLYGGLYTINDIADVESDAQHPQKKNRPLPSKKISIPSAFIFALIIIFIGLALGYFYFGINVFLIYILFILVNQIYTHFAKKIPYLEILFNSLTYPMRLFLGVVLTGGKVPYFFAFAILFLAIGVACTRRFVEKKSEGWMSRKVLRYYTSASLALCQIITFLFIVAIFIVDYPTYILYYEIVLFVYVIIVFGTYFSSSIFKFMRYMWLN